QDRFTSYPVVVSRFRDPIAGRDYGHWRRRRSYASASIRRGNARRGERDRPFVSRAGKRETPVNAVAGNGMQTAPRRWWPAPLVLCLLSILSGCGLDETKLTLAVTTPGSYRAARPLPAPAPATDWPRDFRSPELARLAADAQAGNLDIAAAIARIAQADAQARIDAAGLYPTLDASGDASRSGSPGTLRSKRGPFKTSASNQFSLGLS